MKGTVIAVIADTLSFSGLQEDSVAWRLLRAQNAPAIIAILDCHLGNEQNRRLVSELTELVDADLEIIRERAPELGLGQTAHYYCEQWRHQGYLVRKPYEDTRSEVYELSGGALAAIGFAKSLAKPHRAATQSRLSTIIDRIASLSLATDSSISRRRAALLAERERIDLQLERLEAGEVDVLDDRLAIEQARDILSLAREVPRDFVSVSTEFDQVSRALYSQLINSDDGYQDILENVFAGVDQIGQSPAGQSFRGFYSLLRDTEASESLQDNIDAILDAEFSSALDAEERRFLRRLMRVFIDQGRDVNETMTGLARGLRRFVQSQSFQRDRALKRAIDSALASSHALSGSIDPTERIGVELELTSLLVAPISRMELYNPANTVAEPVAEAEETIQEPLSIEELRAVIREEEIDFAELTGNVNACVADSEAHVVSVGEVLERFPATQGIASVIGLMSLAFEHGISPVGGDVEEVRWTSNAGIGKKAQIPLLRFNGEVA